MHLSELVKLIVNDETMAAHFDRIRKAVDDNQCTVDFTDLGETVNNDNVYALTSNQVTYLRNKGYTVEYEKYLDRPWIVSGWS